MDAFDGTFLRKLEYLSIVSRRVFRGQLLAQRRTRALGSGLEFADHRDYTPGDDFRHLDWNLFARHDRLLLKRFEEEEDLHVFLLLDASRSMAHGTPAKFDQALRVAAALAYIALADLDRVAILAYADGILAELPLARGKERILSVLRFLEGLAPSGRDTDLLAAVRALVHRPQRRGTAIVLSDLFDPRGYERGLDLLRHHGYDVSVVQIVDPSEAEPDLLGDVELVDVEGTGVRSVTITEAASARYRERFAAFQRGVDAYARRNAIGCTRTTTRVPFDELLLSMMRTSGVVR